MFAAAFAACLADLKISTSESTCRPWLESSSVDSAWPVIVSFESFGCTPGQSGIFSDCGFTAPPVHAAPRSPNRSTDALAAAWSACVELDLRVERIGCRDRGPDERGHDHERRDLLHAGPVAARASRIFASTNSNRIS